MKNQIEEILLNQIKNPKNIFVFPTQTAADLWADRIITISDVTAVAMDRFLAWDTFKGQSIRSQHQDKTSIPSAMRKIFADQIITENATEPFFKNLIVPEFAKNSVGFTNWIASLLPSLSNWKRYFEKSGDQPDDQDSDLLELYKRYSQFLDSFNFFDPAWETPPFEADGNHYFIFYPEILSDYFEYEKILKESDDITIINLEISEENKSEVKLFNNSRIELKNVTSLVRQLHDNPENPIPWADIAISVPNMETYGAYLDRELSLYEIPHLMRNATPLSSTGAGSLFDQIKQCAASNFSYDSIKTLLLNNELPWASKKSIDQLLEFGQINHCICSFEYGGQNIDVWEKSLKTLQNLGEERVSTFYHSLKNSINKLTNAKSFAEIRDFYFEFRNKMFDMTLCSQKSDLILSRCITELGELLDLERDFLNNENSENPKITLSSPYNFFTSYISEINYLEQTDELGVQILPYKLSATAPFGCQIIVNSSQASLSVIYQQLTFLREDKRKRILGRDDPNVTEQFIQLYAMNSYSAPAYFTAAVKTFDGYAQTASYLIEKDLSKEKDKKILYGDYLYDLEKDWILKNNSEKFPEKITEIQSKGMNSWIFSQNFENNLEKSQIATDTLVDRISKHKINFSKTQLDVFNSCPRQWIFEKVLYLQEEDNVAVLMDKFQMGNLYHKVFEIYCQNLKHHKPNPLPIHTTEEGLSDEYKAILEKSVTDAIESPENAYLTKQLLYTTKTALDKVIANAIQKFSTTFEGCTVLDNEGAFEYENPEKNYKCNGRIDCLLKDPASGETILIDFKSSQYSIPSNLFAKPDDEEAPLPDFQMPMYIYLMRNSTPPIQIDNACFYDVSKGSCHYVFGDELSQRLNMKEEYMIEPTSFEPTINTLISTMDSISERISNNDFSIDTKVQTFTHCAGCAYNTICRKTFNVGKKE